MGDEEIAEVLAALEELLISIGLGFIVNQERVLAAEGVSQSPAHVVIKREESSDRARPYEATFTDRIRTVGPDEPDVVTGPSQGRSSSAQKARFKPTDAVVTPLNPRDRLSLLLDLIEVATAGTIAMEQEVLDELHELRRDGGHRQRTELHLQSGAGDEWAQNWDGTVVFADPPESRVRGQELPRWTLANGDASAISAYRALEVTSILGELRVHAEVLRGAWLAPYSGFGESDDMWQLRRERGRD